MLPRESPSASATSRPAALPREKHAAARRRELAPAGADRTVIDLATGVLMGRYHCSVAEATEQLVLLGWITKLSVREVAQSIVDEFAWGPPDAQDVQPPRSDVGRPNTHYIHLTRGDLDRHAARESAARKVPGTDTDEPNVGGAGHGRIG